MASNDNPRHMKIAFVGAPNTGKTTLAQETVKKLLEMGNTAHFVPEYAREFISKNGPAKNLKDEIHIHTNQYKREANCFKKNGVIVMDAPIFLNYIYLSNALKREIGEETVDIYLKNIGAASDKNVFLNRYTHVFFLDFPKDVSWNNDPGRAHGPEEAKEIGNKINEFLRYFNIPHKKLSSSYEKRMKEIFDTIKDDL